MEDPNGRPGTAGDPDGGTHQVDVVPSPHGTRVVLRGEVDASVRDEVSDAFEDAARRGVPVEVDCADVEFIDSAGLSSLAWLANLTADPPLLLDVPPTMLELLRLTGMDTAFGFGTRETLG